MEHDDSNICKSYGELLPLSAEPYARAACHLLEGLEAGESTTGAAPNQARLAILDYALSADNAALAGRIYDTLQDDAAICEGAALAWRYNRAHFLPSWRPYEEVVARSQQTDGGSLLTAVAPSIVEVAVASSTQEPTNSQRWHDYLDTARYTTTQALTCMAETPDNLQTEDHRLQLAKAWRRYHAFDEAATIRATANNASAWEDYDRETPLHLAAAQSLGRRAKKAAVKRYGGQDKQQQEAYKQAIAEAAATGAIPHLQTVSPALGARQIAAQVRENIAHQNLAGAQAALEEDALYLTYPVGLVEALCLMAKSRPYQASEPSWPKLKAR